MPDFPKVLIVDDDEQFCRSLQKWLTRRRVPTQYVCRSEQVPDRIGGAGFDVVLLDLKMPGTGGIELLKWIKQQGTSPEVIILSGHASVESAMESVHYGAYDYLVKPCDPEEIRIKVLLAYARNH